MVKITSCLEFLFLTHILHQLAQIFFLRLLRQRKLYWLSNHWQWTESLPGSQVGFVHYVNDTFRLFMCS